MLEFDHETELGGRQNDGCAARTIVRDAVEPLCRAQVGAKVICDGKDGRDVAFETQL